MTGYGKRVLVVDDEMTVREWLARCLEEDEFVVIPVTDGQQALRERQARHFDAVITDVHMSNLNGRDFLRQCRMAWPSLPVILMSGNHDVVVELAMARGAYACLPKPVDPARLKQVLREASGTVVVSGSIRRP